MLENLLSKYNSTEKEIEYICNEYKVFFHYPNNTKETVVISYRNENLRNPNNYLISKFGIEVYLHTFHDMGAHVLNGILQKSVGYVTSSDETMYSLNNFSHITHEKIPMKYVYIREAGFNRLWFLDKLQML